MYPAKNIIYLPIRALGDFIITAAVVKDRVKTKIPIILPNYLDDLFITIEGDRFFNVVGKVSFSNQPAFFELYTVKNFKNIKRLARDIVTINSILNVKDQYIVDYSSRRLFFTGADIIWPKKKDNIYNGKLDLFAKNDLIMPGADFENSVNSIELSQLKKILIIPDSRIMEKSINDTLIKAIIDHFKDFNISVARFSKTEQPNTQRHYSNFLQLTGLINSYDLIISAESLPYHLANFLGKPHFVIYNPSRHFKTSFMTPFMLENNSYSNFNGSNLNQIITDIEKLIYKK